MTLDVGRLSPPPAGFGLCPRCAYLQAGTPEICYSCALTKVQDVGGIAPRCQVCDSSLKADRTCGNPLCGWADRSFDWNRAIAYRTGALERVLNSYKFDGKKGWALILGRLLVAFLEAQRDEFRQFNLIAGNPAFMGRGAARDWDPVRTIIDAAASLTGSTWPFDLGRPPVIVKIKPTTPMKQVTNWRERKRVAEKEIRASLVVPGPQKVKGGSILVFDDLFTDGFTLNEVARCLLANGARRVCGVSIARQMYRVGGH